MTRNHDEGPGESEELNRDEKAGEQVAACADETSVPAVDGGWGWVVVIGYFIQEFFTSAIMRCFTLIYVELVDRFGESDTATSAVMTIFATLYFTSMLVVGSLANRFSARCLSLIGCILFGGGHILTCFAPNLFTIYVTYAAFLGISSSLRSTPAQVLVNKYFKKRRSRAFSLANLGRGIASFVMPPVIAACFSEYAWSGGMLVLSAISLHVFIGPAAFRPVEDNYPKNRLPKMKEMYDIKKSEPKANADERDQMLEVDKSKVNELDLKKRESSKNRCCLNLCQKKEKKIKGNKKKRLLHTELLKDSWYMCYLVSLFFFNIGILSMIFLAPLGRENGYSQTQIILLVSLYGVADMVGSILLGLLLDHKYLRTRRYHVCYVMYVLTGLSSLGLGVAKIYPLMAFCVVCRGLAVSIYSLRIPIMSEVVGDERLASGIALSAPALGLGNFLSPLIGGLLKDRFHTHTVVMYFAGVCFIVAGLIMCASHFVHKALKIHPKCKHRADKTEERV